jgi:SAM-dependent methyltransferase
MKMTPPSEPDLETQLAARIDPWLEHMRWRQDFVAWRERRLHQERHQGEKVTSVRTCIGSPEERAVLDLGAGMGGFAVALSLEGARVIALEFNGDYCRIIRLRGRRHGLDLPIAQGAGEGLPFPAGQFDLCCAWDVLEHVQDPRAVLREAHRVLRPGGAFMLTVINRWAYRDPHYHLPWINWLPRPWAEYCIRRAARGKQGAAFADRQALSEMHYFSFRAFGRLARETGFCLEDLQERRLRQGALVTRRPWRRRIRRLLRTLGLEGAAYRVARALLLPLFEVVLWKET